jgi:hypothetical protein
MWQILRSVFLRQRNSAFPVIPNGSANWNCEGTLLGVNHRISEIRPMHRAGLRYNKVIWIIQTLIIASGLLQSLQLTLRSWPVWALNLLSAPSIHEHDRSRVSRNRPISEATPHVIEFINSGSIAPNAISPLLWKSAQRSQQLLFECYLFTILSVDATF